MQSLEVSKEKNKAPILIFDKHKILLRAQGLQRFCYNNNIELYFAVKACSELSILSLIAPYVDGFDVSNKNELEVIQNFKKPVSIYDPTGQTESYDNGTYISERPEFLKSNQAKFLRFNATELFPSKTQSRFGFSIQEFSQEKNIEGVHIHLRELHEYSLSDFQLIVHFILRLHPKISILNLGGGWHKLENNNDYQKILQTLRRENPNLKLRIEPGRFFTFNCGEIRGQVVSINRHRLEITTNISSYLHLNWSQPQLQYLNETGDQIEIRIFGPTCYEFDKIGTFSVTKKWFNSLQNGDEVCFKEISSYTLQRQGEFNGYKKIPILLK